MRQAGRVFLLVIALAGHVRAEDSVTMPVSMPVTENPETSLQSARTLLTAPPPQAPLALPPKAKAIPRYDLAAYEAAIILACGTGWYWIDKKTNRPDWDNPSFASRFDGDAWRLDTNSFGVNFVGHPLTGALSYSVARAHRLEPWSAFAFAFGTSLGWELGIEFKEKVSTNDVIVTGPSGVPVGEVVYKAGVEVLDALYPDDGVPEAAVNRWRRAEVSLEAGALLSSPAGAGDAESLRSRVEMVWLPGYRTSGDAARWFGQVEVASIAVDVPRTSQGAGFDAEASVVLAGYQAQHYDGDGLGRRGWSVMAGTPFGYRYRASSDQGFRELLATLRMPGLLAAVAFDEPGFRAEVQLEAHVDFAGISAPAYAQWAATHLDLIGKSILRREGYFYGFGPSATARVVVGSGPFEVTGEASALALRSIDGMDRVQEALQVDERARAGVFEAAVRASWALPWTGIRPFVRGAWSRWSSVVDGNASLLVSDRATAGVQLTF